MSSVSGFESHWVIVPQVRGPYETAYGVKTHYSALGAGEPLIMVHGGGPGASGAVGWANTIPALAKHFRVYAIDLIGNGESDIPKMEYSLPMLADHVAGFIDALKLRDVRIMGNSQGAYVAMKYALDYPARVKAVALISTGTLSTACRLTRRGNALTLPTFDGSKKSLRDFMAMIVNDPAKLTDELIDSRFAAASRPGHLEYMQSIDRFRKVMAESPTIGQSFYVRERMQVCKLPNIVLWGEQDRTAPLDPLGMDFKALVPDIPFHVIKGSGHQVQNDKPEECNRLLVEHFTSIR